MNKIVKDKTTGKLFIVLTETTCKKYLQVIDSDDHEIKFINPDSVSDILGVDELNTYPETQWLDHAALNSGDLVLSYEEIKAHYIRAILQLMIVTGKDRVVEDVVNYDEVLNPDVKQPLQSYRFDILDFGKNPPEIMTNPGFKEQLKTSHEYKTEDIPSFEQYMTSRDAVESNITKKEWVSMTEIKSFLMTQPNDFKESSPDVAVTENPSVEVGYEPLTRNYYKNISKKESKNSK